MGVYIPGIKLPTPQLTDGPSVYSAFIIVNTDGRAAIVVDDEEGLDSTEYSLINVTPHGRLGDLDALHKLFLEKGKEYKGVGGAMVAAAAWCIANAPTIIPAEPLNEEANE